MKDQPPSQPALARSSCAGERTNTPNSCGTTPPLARSAIQLPTNAASSLSLLSDRTTAGGPLNTETVSLRSSSLPSTSGHAWAEKPVRLSADLVGCAVIDA